MYTLTYDMDSGMWMSMHVMAAPVTVALGTSGSVDLQQAEDNMKPAAVMVALGTSGSVELQQAEDLSLVDRRDGVRQRRRPPGGQRQ
jgi:ribonuclease PH